MQQELRQADVEDLSAYLDGELEADRRAAVEGLIRSDAAWRAERDRLEALDRVLEVYDVPAPPGDLAERVLGTVRVKVRRGKVLRWVWPLAGAAAAAAVILVAALLSAPEPQPTASTNTQHIAKKRPVPDEVEQAIVEHLRFVRDLDVLENYETLEAIERIELASRGI